MTSRHHSIAWLLHLLVPRGVRVVQKVLELCLEIADGRKSTCPSYEIPIGRRSDWFRPITHQNPNRNIKPAMHAHPVSAFLASVPPGVVASAAAPVPVLLLGQGVQLCSTGAGKTGITQLKPTNPKKTDITNAKEPNTHIHCCWS